MEKEIILSAGIDIGTTTTHLVISRLVISVSRGFGVPPQAEIAAKEIVYQSPVYFTPLLENGDINGAKVAQIIQKEYAAAGVTKADLKSGAVIVTGESAAKGNAQSVIHAVSELAGDFIAAQAGSELESLLSGRGAGADTLSRETDARVANIDIGGGTTNISVFESGDCVDTCCLHIGGRLIKKESAGICVSGAMQRLLQEENIKINSLEDSAETMIRLCSVLAGYIFTALGFCGGTLPQYLVTDHLLSIKKPDIVTFSGGVAECMHRQLPDFAFGDIGVLLARAVQDAAKHLQVRVEPAGRSAIRATVIGAGQFSMEISGSTIRYSDIELPLKNLPCVKYISKLGSAPCALCLSGGKAPSFLQLTETAQKIVSAAEQLINRNIPLVVMTEADYSMALGQCLKRLLPKHYPLLCADGICCKEGDYIDIGKPVAGGMAVPVVVKTLVFGGTV